jgi:hypothetical protein
MSSMMLFHTHTTRHAINLTNTCLKTGQEGRFSLHSAHCLDQVQHAQLDQMQEDFQKTQGVGCAGTLPPLEEPLGVLSHACDDLVNGRGIKINPTAHIQVPVEIQVPLQSILYQDYRDIRSKLEPNENGSGLALLKRLLSLLSLSSLGAKTYYAMLLQFQAITRKFICCCLSSTICVHKYKIPLDLEPLAVLSLACDDLFNGGEILLDATAHNQVPIQIQV